MVKNDEKERKEIFRVILNIINNDKFDRESQFYAVYVNINKTNYNNNHSL